MLFKYKKESFRMYCGVCGKEMFRVNDEYMVALCDKCNTRYAIGSFSPIRRIGGKWDAYVLNKKPDGIPEYKIIINISDSYGYKTTWVSRLNKHETDLLEKDVAKHNAKVEEDRRLGKYPYGDNK